MNSDYLEVPERLHAYRKVLSLSQEEMARRFGIGQDHYSKIENGSNIISYHSLKTFEESGGDVSFLITGRKRVPGICDEYLARCRTDNGKREFLELMVWLTGQGMRRAGTDRFRELEMVWKYIRLHESGTTPDVVWKNIREIENLSQVNMAARLDINVKRYQRMEGLQTKPDAEILHTLYVRFGYSPLLLLGHKYLPVDEINGIWEEFPEEVKNRLTDMLEMGMRMIEERNLQEESCG